VACGGSHQGAVHEPTVLAGVTPQMRIYAEESFGPVVTVVSADDADDAVRIANDTEYGLAAAVFGRDTDRALGVATRIESGICHVNGPTVHDEATAPFGGVKASGWGRFGSGQVADEFTNLRWITVSRQERPTRSSVATAVGLTGRGRCPGRPRAPTGRSRLWSGRGRRSGR
jgi:acyl-CoA reductase-like NAD-dependent aldehyde dehydrogenase